MSFDRSLGSPLFIVGDIIVVPVEETGRGLFKEIFFVVRWLSTYCIKSPFRIWISGWIWKTFSQWRLLEGPLEGFFWFSWQELRLVKRSSCWKLIQKKPSTLESGINVPIRLLIFGIFSRSYSLITDFRNLNFTT